MVKFSPRYFIIICAIVNEIVLFFSERVREHAHMGEGQREREGGREKGGERERERERENLKQAPCSPWSSSPRTWDHDPSQNQELDAQPTEPPRCPLSSLFYGFQSIGLSPLWLGLFLDILLFTVQW